MELWIRSQDKKELVKVNRITLCNVGEILTFDNQENEINLGNYTPYERALEVLNEIQRHLTYINDENNAFYTYQMPKE